MPWCHEKVPWNSSFSKVSDWAILYLYFGRSERRSPLKGEVWTIRSVFFFFRSTIYYSTNYCKSRKLKHFSPSDPNSHANLALCLFTRICKVLKTYSQEGINELRAYGQIVIEKNNTFPKEIYCMVLFILLDAEKKIQGYNKKLKMLTKKIKIKFYAANI